MIKQPAAELCGNSQVAYDEVKRHCANGGAKSTVALRLVVYLGVSPRRLLGFRSSDGVTEFGMLSRHAQQRLQPTQSYCRCRRCSVGGCQSILLCAFCL